MTRDDAIPTTSSRAALDRRVLLRGGALLAGATAVAAVASVAAPQTADAANGDELVIGAGNQGAGSTVLTLTPGGAAATAVLVNDAGPTLRLVPVGEDFDGLDLQAGDIVNTELGPFIGVVDDDGDAYVDILATGADLDALPTPVAITPERLLDTRTAQGRKGIVRKSSTTAVGSDGKLRGGQWIDVVVDTAQGPFALSSIFANAVAVTPDKGGYLTVYPPANTQPATSNVNYRQGVTTANAAFVGLGVYAGNYVVRIYTSQTTHVILDLSGAVVGAAGPTPATTNARTRTQRQQKRLAKMKKSLERS